MEKSVDKLNVAILCFLVAGGSSAGVGLSARKTRAIAWGVLFIAVGAGLLFGVR
jgi:hypothetical protein